MTGALRGHYPFMQWKAWLTIGGGLLIASCGSSSRSPTPAPSCQPGSTFCQERQVWRCGAVGEEATLVESCAAAEECSDKNGQAQCQATCFPGRLTCNGNVATLCAEDGSGPLPGGEDCEANRQICREGACAMPDCTPGELICFAGDVYVCDITGKAVALIDDCVEGEICDDSDVAVCAVLSCETGVRACDQTRVVECNEKGTAWNATDLDCADQGELCFEGQCVVAQCPAGAWKCMDNAAYVCPDGLGWDTDQACGGNQHCVESADMSSALCFDNDCLPGSPVCHFNTLKTCSEQGTYPAEGTDCGDEICWVDSCRPVICELGETTCTDGDVYTCNMLGIFVLGETCPDGMTCTAPAAHATCAPQTCNPTETACIGNALGECGEDGLSLASVTEDCAAGGNVCNASNACVPSVVDAFGTPEGDTFINIGDVVTNVIDVHSNRLVSELEANLSLSQPCDLRWVIAKWNGSSYDPLVNQITTNQQGSGYFSSGALASGIEAGQRYALGVGIAVADELESVYYDPGPSDVEASFGTVVGSNRSFYDFGIDDALDAGIFAIRVTTELP